MLKRPEFAHIVVHDPADEGALTPSPLTRISRGARVRVTEWDQMFAEGRLRTRARAVDARCSTPTSANSHWTAAALHGLPVHRMRSDRIDLIVPGAHTRRDSKDVTRHQGVLPDEDVMLIDGMRVTVLDRTVYDVIRTGPLEAAASCFDAALRKVAWDEQARTYDDDSAERFRRLVRARIAANAGARGIRQARFVTTFADGRAQLPGESIARLWMHLLGVPAPELQYRVERGGGRFALLDFAWPELRRWAEFDGRGKYDDPTVRGDRTRAEVLEEQAEREAHVRALTGWSSDRFGFDQMPGIDAFADHLRSIGLLR